MKTKVIAIDTTGPIQILTGNYWGIGALSLEGIMRLSGSCSGLRGCMKQGDHMTTFLMLLFRIYLKFQAHKNLLLFHRVRNVRLAYRV